MSDRAHISDFQPWRLVSESDMRDAGGTSYVTCNTSRPRRSNFIPAERSKDAKLASQLRKYGHRYAHLMAVKLIRLSHSLERLLDQICIAEAGSV